jgi:metal-responsive CopG/Arc/MetJ family transcriptional regulator
VSKGRKIVRGAKRRDNGVFIGVWVPEPVAAAVDKAVQSLDLDRSEFLRSALVEKIKKEAQ